MKEKLKKIYFKITGKIKQRKFKYKDFTIISNNCFGGIVYRNNDIPYNTPTAGLFFMADDYIKFIYNMKEYLNMDLVEIKLKNSKHYKYLNSINYSAPIGKLGDVEIMFLHYPTFAEAKEKWERRKKRINYDKIIYKFCEQNECMYEHLKKFDEFKADNKICFTYNNYPELNTIQFKEFENDPKSFSDVVEKIFKKYINIYDYVNSMKINPKVLMVLSDLDNCNGITSYVMNYYKNMDLSKIKIDFVLTSDKINKEYKNVILENNSNIYTINYENSVLDSVKETKKFMKENSHKYDIIHSHLINKGYFFLKYAKKYGIKNRIIHSHNTTLGNGSKIRNIVNIIFKNLTLSNANQYFACSNLAGKYLFKNKKFKIINNAINIEKFIYNEKLRNKYRKQLKIENKYVIGQVGRIAYQKNHIFFCEVFKELLKKNKDIVWLIIGNGELENEIKDNVKKLNIDKNVIFLGSRNDVNELYSAFDLFIMPSHFEGLPVVAIEAQANGVDCLLSDNITKETKLISLVEFLPLIKEKWVNFIAKKIKKETKRTNVNLKNLESYDIINTKEKLEIIYRTLN